MPILEDIVQNIPLDNLGAQWHPPQKSLNSFSHLKELYDFQSQALENALKTLWLYYGQNHSNQKTDNQPQGGHLKLLYKESGIIDALLPSEYDYELKRKKNYKPKDKNAEDIFTVNRLGLWMATGSGKTLVIVKLIEMLSYLMKQNVIPKRKIMFLVYRDELIEQFTRHVDEYNSFHTSNRIICRDLKGYEKAGFGLPLPNQLAEVFFYRADLFLAKKKSTTKKINTKTCDNKGEWYVILDEAHRGDKTDSPLQKIYNKFARNGFLFNFSATFTDEVDIKTCAFNFNLERFIEEGYGKKIYVSAQNIRGFNKDHKEINDSAVQDAEKQKVILRSLLLKTYINMQLKKLQKATGIPYHSPLILTITNTVTDKSSDLRLFFRELAKIGAGKMEDGILEEVRASLVEEMKEASYVFDKQQIPISAEDFKKINYKNILSEVFNAESFGQTQIITIPKNKKEMIFKLASSNSAFALIRIGDRGISQWKKDILENENYQLHHFERYDDLSFFRNINENKDHINILMGSRSFYEGWDSNRPNIVLFINIGVGKSKKFVLQAVGRGVRIEPEQDKRKRLLSLRNDEGKDYGLSDIKYRKMQTSIAAIESLFVLGTDADNLNQVIEELSKKSHPLGAVFQINEEAKTLNLLVPVYRETNEFYNRAQGDFPIGKDDFHAVKNLSEHLSDEMLLMKYDCSAEVLDRMHKGVKDKDIYYSDKEESLGLPVFLLGKLFDYLALRNSTFEKFSKLGDEDITHFRQIKYHGSQEDYEEIKKRINFRLKNYQGKYDNAGAFGYALIEKYKKSKNAKKISIVDYVASKEYNEQLRLFDASKLYNDEVEIEYLSRHYYNPLLLTKKAKIDYLSQIIKVESEFDFINNLRKNLESENSIFHKCDWWMFSKLDELIDNIFIPYYSPNRNDFAKFHPDFIFWLQKGKRYHIIFVDPKSTAFTDYSHKADGYNHFFGERSENGETKRNPEKLVYNKLEVFVHLRFYGKKSEAIPGYEHLWIDNIEKMIDFPL